MGNYGDYKREEYRRAEPGDYRVSIVEVEDTTSKAGNAMLVVTIQPNGYDVKVKHYIVKNEYFNRNMTQFFDSFNIDEGDFNFLTWPGAVGAARLKEDERGYLKVAWFLSKKRAESLPEWAGPMPERQVVDSMGFAEVDPNDDLPF